jgi:hypothetical protein
MGQIGNTADDIVDVMAVPATGDPARAVVTTKDLKASGPARRCDVLIVGGGTGGIAAAIAARRAGLDVCLTEETDWLGGQFSAQGVSALDEHDHIEQFGGTALYYEFRNRIRRHYRDPDLTSAAGHSDPFNPGNCWVTRLAFEPRVAAGMVRAMAEAGPGRFSLFLRAKAFAVVKDGNRISEVSVLNLETRETTTFEPRLVIDATELGDLLPLAGIDHVIGAESAEKTGEPGGHPDGHRDHCVQSYTYTFGLERGQPGDNNNIPKPAHYERNKLRQPYSLTIEVHGGEIYGEVSGHLRYSVFDTMPDTKGSLWTYRRLIDSALIPAFPRDISMINWPGNDYRDGNLLTATPVEMATALQQAKLTSLGFLHWLQTEAPAQADRTGASELRLRPDVMDTADGLSKFPYIREARRIRAVRTIREQDVSAKFQPGLRAAHFPDSVGIGWYPIDIHRSTHDEVGTSARTKPFQIPLGALLPRGGGNLIAAAKNIGTTHITNGCYRLHPVEWNIGEAAGYLCAFALKHDQSPREIHANPQILRAFQDQLLGAGVPLAWRTDTGVTHSRFAAAQREFMDRPEDFAGRL